MAYAIMRFQKYKLSGLGKIERHNNERTHLKGRANPELEKYNTTKKLFENETLTQTIRKIINSIKKEKGKTTRKDAAVISEFVFTFSPEAQKDILPRMKEWKRANIQWLMKEFESRGAKILRVDTHYDETTIHQHCFVQMTDERGLFCANRFFGKKNDLEKLQTSYAEKMSVFGLKRGKSKKETKARHTTLNEYYKATESKIKHDIELLKQDSERIAEKQKELAEMEKMLDSQKENVEELLDSIFNDEVKKEKTNNDFER